MAYFLKKLEILPKSRKLKGYKAPYMTQQAGAVSNETAPCFMHKFRFIDKAGVGADALIGPAVGSTNLPKPIANTQHLPHGPMWASAPTGVVRLSKLPDKSEFDNLCKDSF